jgi:predicted RNA binding protein YcfA (HicA-like mRNA interferase family)
MRLRDSATTNGAGNGAESPESGNGVRDSSQPRRTRENATQGPNPVTCEHCAASFVPRRSGTRQRYCSARCRERAAAARVRRAGNGATPSSVVAEPAARVNELAVEPLAVARPCQRCHGSGPGRRRRHRWPGGRARRAGRRGRAREPGRLAARRPALSRRLRSPPLMGGFRSMKASELYRLLERALGYDTIRHSGSHRTMKARGRPTLHLAFHDKQTIPPGLVRKILVKDVGLSIDDAEALL